MKAKLFDTPSDVHAEPGKVIADGPGGEHIEFTPAAAFETAARLETAALEAEGSKTWRKD